jgi:hypothetical protein
VLVCPGHCGHRLQLEKKLTEEKEMGRQQQQQKYADDKGCAEDLEQVAVRLLIMLITD